MRSSVQCEQLFCRVIQDSAAQVSDALITQTRTHLATVTDVESELIALARAWVATMARFPDHFALVRQVNAEAGHLPKEVLDVWQQAGPLAARAELAHHLGLLARQGLLDADDPQRAARHFHLLAFAEITELSHHGALPVDDAQITEIITYGVRAFLRGYLPCPTTDR